MLRKSPLLAIGGAAIAALALIVSTALAVAAVARGTISVTLTDKRADPERVMRVGDTAVLSGVATVVPSGSAAVLQVRNGGGAWRGVGRGPVDAGGHFRVVWHIRKHAQGNIDWRVVILHAGATIGRTSPEALTVGSAFVACAAPAVNVPQGEGAVVGGLYYWGGAYPGVDRCSTHSYTVQALDASGNTVASGNIGAGHGYLLAAQPGSYILQAGNCAGPKVKIVSGQVTHANIFCRLP